MPTLRNLAIDSVTGGYVVTGGKIQFVYDKDGIRQAIRCLLRTFLGEWFLDDPTSPQVGIPYIQSILAKGIDPRAVANLIAKKISNVAGVVGVASVNLAYDKKTRVLSLAYDVPTDAGLLSESFSSTG